MSIKINEEQKNVILKVFDVYKTITQESIEEYEGFSGHVNDVKEMKAELETLKSIEDLLND